MALGGGNFTAQDKILPGTYINFITAGSAVNVQDRGIAAVGLILDWGADDTIISVTAKDAKRNSLKIFGYELSSDKMLNVREVFKHAQKLITYKLNTGGAKATCTYGEALYKGTRGNDLSIVIAANADDTSKFDVTTKLGSVVVDAQTVAAATALVNNDFISFKTGATLVAGTTKLTGGTNGTASGTSHQAFLNALESYAFNNLGVDTADESTKALYVAYTKRMRDELGIKFQLIVYADGADYEGVINVKNTVSDSGASASALIYWVTGAEAGCSVDKSLTNMTYDGEYTVTAAYTQAQLETAVNAGEFVFHMVADETRVLLDINSLITFTAEKSSRFSKNDTVRVIDDIGTEVAALFDNSYIGKVRNTKAGRNALWSAIVDIHRSLETAGAIENYDTADLSIEAGDETGTVVITDAITVTGAMEKLYMTVVAA